MDFTDLDIKVGGTTSVKKEVSEGAGANYFSGPPKKTFKDRRKNRRDRRKSVREGIFVSLSVGNDRRMLRDRRKAN